MRLYSVILNIVTSALIGQRNGTSEIDFEAFREPLVYDEAEKACQNKGMVLATIKSEEENKELTEYLENFTRQTSLTNADEAYNYWIGLRRKISKPKLWFWEADKASCTLTNKKDGRFWGVNPPEGVGGGDILIRCVRMKVNSGPNYTFQSNWEAHRCDWPQGTTGYVCQKPNKSLCAKKAAVSTDEKTGGDNPDKKKEPDAGSTLVINMVLLILFIAA